MINIAFLMNGAKSPRGGEFLSLYLITHLNKDIFRPILIYASDGPIVQEIKKNEIETYQIPLNKNITNIYPREINLHNPIFICAFFWRLLTSGSIMKLKWLIEKNDIQLIYCADNLSKLMGGIIGKILGTKVVAHCHDDFKEDIMGRIMRVFYLLLLDRILAVSEKVRSFFVSKGSISSKAVTVYNGIDTDIFDPDKITSDMRVRLGIDQDAIVIGSIGVIEQDKGQKYLFEAMERLLSEADINVLCVVCGAGPEEARLKNFVRLKGLEDKVFFLGYQTDIPLVLKMLDIFVMTSLTIESFSLAVVEAMAMKVPVIVTNVGGLPEVIDDGRTGILIPPKDVDALYKALKYLITNSRVRIEMGLNGRKRVLDHFTIGDNVRKTEEVFLEVLRSN